MSMVDDMRPEYFYGREEDEDETDEGGGEKLAYTEQEVDEPNCELGNSYLYDADDSELEWYQK